MDFFILLFSFDFCFVDADTLTKLEPYRQGVLSQTDEVIGKTQVFLQGATEMCRIQECNIGKQTAVVKPSAHRCSERDLN